MNLPSLTTWARAAVASIPDLSRRSSSDPLALNQASRWVSNKEAHATYIISECGLQPPAAPQPVAAGSDTQRCSRSHDLRVLLDAKGEAREAR